MYLLNRIDIFMQLVRNFMSRAYDLIGSSAFHAPILMAVVLILSFCHYLGWVVEPATATLEPNKPSMRLNIAQLVITRSKVMVQDMMMDRMDHSIERYI